MVDLERMRLGDMEARGTVLAPKERRGKTADTVITSAV